jgi:hypothetical protein
MVMLASWGVGLVVTSRRSAVSTEGEPRDLRALVGVTVLVAAAAFALRFVWAAPVPIHDDSMRDIGVAAAGATRLMPASASLGGLEHGSSFVRFVSFAFDLGLEIRGVQLVLMLCLGLGVGLIAGEALRCARSTQGEQSVFLTVGLVASLALCLLGRGVIDDGEVLWNPSLLPLPLAVTQVLMLRAAVSRHAGLHLLAGLFAGLSFDVHISCIVFLPAVAVLAMASAQGKDGKASWVSLAFLLVGLTGGALGLPILLSPGSAYVNSQALFEQLGAAGIALAVVWASVVGLFLRRWCDAPERDGPRRLRRLTAALALPLFFLGGALAMTSPGMTIPEARYWVPASPALALALGLGLGWLLSKLKPSLVRTGLGVLACVALLAWTLNALKQRASLDRGRWTFGDLDSLSRVLRERDLRFDDLHLAVFGGNCGDELVGDRGQRHHELLIAGLRAFGGLERTPRPGVEGTTTAWWMTKQPPERDLTLPKGALERPSESGHRLILVPFEPIIDLRRAQRCVHHADAAPVCSSITIAPTDLARRRVMPRHIIEARADASEPSSISYRFPVTSRSERDVLLWLPASGSGLQWRFTRTSDGVEAQGGEGPARRLELHVVPGRDAWVEVATEDAGEAQIDPWLPPIVAVPKSDAWESLLPRTE